jgi:tight adherence protein C
MQFIFDILFSEVVILGATFISIFIVVKTIMPDEEKVLAQERLGVDTGKKVYPNKLIQYYSMLFPFILPLIHSLSIDSYREKIKKKFVGAGVADKLTPDEFVCFKIYFSFTLLCASGYYFATSAGDVSYAKIMGATLFGYFYPNIWLRATAEKRKKGIIAGLPYMMDLLTLSVEAGLDFVAAITRVTQKAKPGPLIDELTILLKEIKLGTARSDALTNLAARIQLPELSSFTTVLVQSDQLGASIGPVLRAQSDLLRAQRFQRAEKAGALATQKILIPLVFFILPTVGIVIFGPVLLERLSGR